MRAYKATKDYVGIAYSSTTSLSIVDSRFSEEKDWEFEIGASPNGIVSLLHPAYQPHLSRIKVQKISSKLHAIRHPNNNSRQLVGPRETRLKSLKVKTARVTAVCV